MQHKTYSNKKLLVLTALEGTWGSAEPILFLGEWCKLYDRRHRWGVRDHKTVQFHWVDRNKLAQDYNYLELLHHTLLCSLAASLNELHQVNYSVRYWQILLDPWLLCYVGVLFDRWENLRIAFEAPYSLEVVFFKNSLDPPAPPFSYLEFISSIGTDGWNQALFQRMIKSEYLDKCFVRAEDGATPPELIGRLRDDEHGLLIKKSTYLFRKLLAIIDQLLSYCCSTYDVVFLASNFKLTSLIRLNLAIAQVPRLFLREFKFASLLDKVRLLDIDGTMRERIFLKFKPNSPFETFLKASIIQDLPTNIIEGYNLISQEVSHLPIKTKIIMTWGVHWSHVCAKFWFARQVDKGTKLVVLEHGGAFPAVKHLFNFEEDISDIKGTWFFPYHEKHIQVPPSKLVNRYKKVSLLSRKYFPGKYCSVIGNEYTRWALRCVFYPVGFQCLTSFEQTIHLYEHLDEKIKQRFKVKPHPDQGVSTGKRYEDILGSERILSEQNIDSVFHLSRVIVCTYPETTFSEAMASGVPTVMLYPRELYEKHPLAEPLLNMLRAANIIFHNAQQAAIHLNEIWDAPKLWWESPQVLCARSEFEQKAACLNANWREEWVSFVKRVKNGHK